MIEARGKTLFEWSMESLAGFADEDNLYIFIVRKEDEAVSFITETCHRMGIIHTRVIEIDAPTDGQATTAMLAQKEWEAESPLLIYNIDTYVEAGEMNENQLSGVPPPKISFILSFLFIIFLSQRAFTSASIAIHFRRYQLIIWLILLVFVPGIFGHNTTS